MKKHGWETTGFFFANRLFGKKRPFQVSFQTTTACNLDCLYCYAEAGEKRDNELNTQEAKHLFKDLKKMGVYVLVLTGGEPLLRPDLDELIQFCAREGLHCSLATNGLLLTRDRALKLKELGLNRFHFSLDGSNEEINSRFRKKGFFAGILRGLDSAVSTRLPVSVQTMITRNNIDDLENIGKLLLENNVSVWRMQFIVPCGRGIALSLQERFNREETLRLIEKVYVLSERNKGRIKIDFHALQAYKVFLYKKAKFNLWQRLILRLKGGCGAIEGTVIYINSDGSVRPCPHFPFELPGVNVKRHSVIDIYRNNPILRSLREKNNLKGACRECKYLFCCGGCRAKAFALTGDFFAADTSCPFD